MKTPSHHRTLLHGRIGLAAPLHVSGDMLRLQDISLGELEEAVLDVLWAEPGLSPGQVHAQVGAARRIGVNTVASALKRLHEKGLLDREKVSHSYVYRTAVSRAELQRLLIGAIAERYADEDGAGLLVAFVDVAESVGPEALERLDALIAARRKAEES